MKNYNILYNIPEKVFVCVDKKGNHKNVMWIKHNFVFKKYEIYGSHKFATHDVSQDVLNYSDIIKFIIDLNIL